MKFKFLEHTLNQRAVQHTCLSHAIEDSRSTLGTHGQIIVDTGKHTGRAANSKFIVKNDAIAYGPAGREMSQEQFQKLTHLFLNELAPRLRAYDFVAAGVKCRVLSTEHWHLVAARNLFSPAPQLWTTEQVELLIVDAGEEILPERIQTVCNTSEIIALNLDEGMCLIAGTCYFGEIKKTVFTYISGKFPERGILPMHASVTVSAQNVDGQQTSAVFFGLSGTGKTTLSADPGRHLLGDDEHIWSDLGVFNIESGCYAKIIDLKRTHEREIWTACHRFGTVIENAVIDADTREIDFKSRAKTENTRAAFPLSAIRRSLPAGWVASHPTDIIMLTCDANGVLPAVSKLNEQQALYHFLLGYTARVAGTETGVRAPVPVFSRFFGAPFMPLQPRVYAELFVKKLRDHKPRVWLVNTGWSGGPVGVGKRFDIKQTRADINSILGNQLGHVKFDKIDEGLQITTAEQYAAQRSWKNSDTYNDAAEQLREQFRGAMIQYVNLLSLVE